MVFTTVGFLARSKNANCPAERRVEHDGEQIHVYVEKDPTYTYQTPILKLDFELGVVYQLHVAQIVKCADKWDADNLRVGYNPVGSVKLSSSGKAYVITLTHGDHGNAVRPKAARLSIPVAAYAKVENNETERVQVSAF